MRQQIFETIDRMEENWKEIDLLIDVIKNEENDDTKLVLCKAAIVLLSANLEGFIKEVIKSLINDLNRIDFLDLPNALKRSFTEWFILRETDKPSFNSNKIDQLIAHFENMNADLLANPFIAEYKNPKPDTLQKTFKKLGVRNFFDNLNCSVYDVIFENERSRQQEILEELKGKFNGFSENTNLYIDLVEDNLLAERNNSNSLWISFLDDFIQKRNSVAHGSQESMSITTSKVEEYKLKIHTLQYLIVMVLYGSLFHVN